MAVIEDTVNALSGFLCGSSQGVQVSKLSIFLLQYVNILPVSHRAVLTTLYRKANSWQSLALVTQLPIKGKTQVYFPFLLGKVFVT